MIRDRRRRERRRQARDVAGEHRAAARAEIDAPRRAEMGTARDDVRGTRRLRPGVFLIGSDDQIRDAVAGDVARPQPDAEAALRRSAEERQHLDAVRRIVERERLEATALRPQGGAADHDGQRARGAPFLAGAERRRVVLPSDQHVAYSVARDVVEPQLAARVFVGLAALNAQDVRARLRRIDRAGDGAIPEHHEHQPGARHASGRRLHGAEGRIEPTVAVHVAAARHRQAQAAIAARPVDATQVGVRERRQIEALVGQRCLRPARVGGTGHQREGAERRSPAGTPRRSTRARLRRVEPASRCPGAGRWDVALPHPLHIHQCSAAWRRSARDGQPAHPQTVPAGRRRVAGRRFRLCGPCRFRKASRSEGCRDLPVRGARSRIGV